MLSKFEIWKFFVMYFFTYVPQVSKKLTPSQIEAVFAKFDANGDGRLSMDEFKQMMERKWPTKDWIEYHIFVSLYNQIFISESTIYLLK